MLGAGVEVGAAVKTDGVIAKLFGSCRSQHGQSKYEATVTRIGGEIGENIVKSPNKSLRTILNEVRKQVGLVQCSQQYQSKQYGQMVLVCHCSC